MIRQAVAAGRFYPSSAAEIRKMMAVLVDQKAKKEAAIGLLMPHAGYPYSGPVAGATISQIKFRDTFIIMGPSHTGAGRPFSIMTEGTWRTPLGDAEINAALGKKLIVTSDYLQEDTTAHLYEHAVEVQIPFLQYLRPDIKIVPIILAYAPAEVYKAIGKDMAKAIKETKEKAVIIASGDMTHYEPQEIAEEKDNKAIKAILKLDEDELTRHYQELDISMCAYGPAVSLITAAKELGATGAELVKYQTSGDATGDYSSVVGYAGIIIKGGGE